MMDIVKKNIVSIICGVVAIAAIVVAFTMLTGKQADLQKELEGRKAVHDSISKLLTATRQLPVVSPDSSETATLTKFPNEKIIKQGNDIIAQVAVESKNMLDEAVKMNAHTLLTPGSLPEPQGVSAFNFRNDYLRYFPAPPTAGGATAPNINQLVARSQFTADLHAGLPPSPEEIKIKLDEKAKEIRDKRLVTYGGTATNEPQVAAEIQEEGRKLPMKLRADVAKNSRVYINPNTFTPWPNIIGLANQPDPADIYGAQLTLWIQQDVINAINDANANSKNGIADAVVKHLIRVQINPMPVLPAGVATPGIDPDAPITPDKTVSPTGRISNGMYDIFHIQIDADVDAAKLPEFLRALGKGRFMTPLWVDLKTVDNALELAQGHDYGKAAVVNAHVQCEVLYLRDWNRKFMPRKVREKLGLPPVDEVKPAEGTAPADPAAAPADPAAAPAAPAGPP